MQPSVRVCGVSVRAPVKGLRGKCSRRNYRLVACATPFNPSELRKMRKEVLVKELTKHDLDTKGTKAQLIERIQTHVANKDSESPPPEKDPLSGRTEKGLMRKKRTWLVEECEKRGLATNGKKLTLIKRLQEYIERKELMSSSEFKKAVDEMQNLVAENGIKIKQRAERIMQKLQSTEELDSQKGIVKEQDDDDEKEANEGKEQDESKEQEDYFDKFAKPVLEDLADCIDGEVDLVSLVEHVGLADLENLVKSQLRSYFSPFIPELTKTRIRKDQMIELITVAYQQEVKDPEKTKEKLKSDGMAEMMAMDQLKLDTGVFIGDIDKSVDNLISEMRSEYGKHIPVEMEEPVSYLSEEELEELEKISEQDFNLETSVEDEVKFSDDEYPESPMGGPDVDERDLMNGRDELFQVEDDDEATKFVSGTRHRHGEKKTGFEEARKDAFLQFEKYIAQNKVDFKVEMDDSSEQDSFEGIEDSKKEQSPVLEKTESPVLEEKMEFESEEDAEITQSSVLEEKEGPVLEDKAVIKTCCHAESQSPVLEEQETSTLEEEEEEEIPIKAEEDMKTTESPVLEEKSTVLEEVTDIKDNDAAKMEKSLVLEDETDMKAEEEIETMQNPVFEQEEEETPVFNEFETTGKAEEETEVKESPVLEQKSALAEQNTSALTTESDISIPDTPMETQEVSKADINNTVEKSDSVLEKTEPVLEENTVFEKDIVLTQDAETIDPVVSKIDSFALKEAAEKIFATYAHKDLLEMSEEAFLDVVKPLNMDINPIRTEFVAKLAELADQELPEVEQNEGNLVELSLSQMGDQRPVPDDKNEIDEDEWVGSYSEGVVVENRHAFDLDDYDAEPDEDEVLEKTVERTAMKMTLTSLPKMDDLDNLNTPKITQVLNELRSQRSEWEDTTKDLLQFLQEKCDAEQQPQKRADLMKGIEALTEEYEDLKERVNEKDEEVVELQSKINRVIFEFDLLSPNIIIGDGNGEFGPLTTYPVESLTDLISFNSNDDDFSLNYHLDTTIQDSTVVFDPSDPQILDQLNSNFKAAADSELFLQNSSDEEDSATPSKEEPSKADLMKKHSSIAVTLAAGISEVWKHFFKSVEPKKQGDAE